MLSMSTSTNTENMKQQLNILRKTNLSRSYNLYYNEKQQLMTYIHLCSEKPLE